MKSCVVLKTKVFTPITIDITFESAEELEILRKMMSSTIQVPECLYDTNTLNYNQKMCLKRMMGNIHDTLLQAKEL